MIVIFGASGNVGGEAARILSERGERLRLVSRGSRSSDEHETAIADYAVKDSLTAAMHPGDTVFMVSVHEHPDVRIEQHRTFIEVASEQRVAHLVYLSFVGASRDSAFWHARSHGVTEELLHACDVPFTIVRTGPYSNYLPYFLLSRDVRVPGGDAPIGWVDRRDCGALVAEVLTRPEVIGSTLNAMGPELLSFGATVNRVNDLLGTQFRYTDVDDPSALPTQGLPEWEIPSRRSFFQAMQDGEFNVPSTDIAALTRQNARSIDVAITDATHTLRSV